MILAETITILQNYIPIKKKITEDFAGGPLVKNPPAKKKKRICLPMHGTQVQSLVQKDPTCAGY